MGKVFAELDGRPRARVAAQPKFVVYDVVHAFRACAARAVTCGRTMPTGDTPATGFSPNPGIRSVIPVDLARSADSGGYAAAFKALLSTARP
jgi:hypothetical protein